MENGNKFGQQEANENFQNNVLMEVFGADPSVLSEQHNKSVDVVLNEDEPMNLLTEYLQR